MQQVSFKCNPIYLTRLFALKYIDTGAGADLYTHLEKVVLHSLINQMDDSLIEEILESYLNESKSEHITFKTDAEVDFICKSILLTDMYRDTMYKKLRSGFTGAGVDNKVMKKFYPCEVGNHFGTLKNIIKEEYPEKYDAFLAMRNPDINEYNGITRRWLDDFILATFRFVGSEGDMMNKIENMRRW